MSEKNSNFAAYFLIPKKGGTYEKDWNGICMAGMRRYGAGC